MRNIVHYFIFKFLFNIKLEKEIEIKVAQTAAQQIFIDLQKQLTKAAKDKVNVKFKKINKK